MLDRMSNEAHYPKVIDDVTDQYVQALRELVGVFQDDDRMSAAQETFAEQARESLTYAAEHLLELARERDEAIEVVRLCCIHMPSDAHSEEGDSDCDWLMKQLLAKYGVQRSDG